MLLPSPFIIIGASPIPLIEMLTTAGDTRAASGAKDSGAAPAAQIGAKAARPEKIARGRARQKPMGLSSKRKRRDALRPAEDLDFELTRKDGTYFAGSFGLPATKLPLPSGLPATKLPVPSGLPATKLPEPSGLPATKLPEPCGPVFAVPPAVWAKAGAAANSPAASSANFKVFIVEISMSRPTGHPWMQFILNCRSKRYVRWRTSGRNGGGSVDG